MLTDDQKAERTARKNRNRGRYLARHSTDVWLMRAQLEKLTTVIVEPPTKSSKGGKRHRNLLEKTKRRFHSHTDVRGGYGWQDSNEGWDDVMRGNKPRHEDRVLNVTYMPRVPTWGQPNWGHSHGH